MKRLLLLIGLVSCRHGDGSCAVGTEDELRASYLSATGKSLPDKLSCVERSTTFPGLVDIGLFADDRGCLWQGTLYGCKWNDAGTPRAAMAAAGWARADAAGKQRLARAWIAEVDQVQIVATKPAHFEKSGKTFTALEAAPAADGGVVLRYWLAHPTGMTPETTYSRVEVTFDAGGVGGPSKELDTATVRLSD